jgi:hypothetical protein
VVVVVSPQTPSSVWSGRNGKTGAVTIDLPKTARNVDFKVDGSNVEWRKGSSA